MGLMLIGSLFLGMTSTIGGIVAMFACMKDMKMRFADKKAYYVVGQFVVAIVFLLAISFGVTMLMVFLAPVVSGCISGCTTEQVARQEAFNGFYYPVLIIADIIGLLLFVINLVRLNVKDGDNYSTTQDYVKYAKNIANSKGQPEQSESIDVSGGIFSPGDNKDEN